MAAAAGVSSFSRVFASLADAGTCPASNGTVPTTGGQASEGGHCVLQTVQETVDTEITARKTKYLRKCNLITVLNLPGVAWQHRDLGSCGIGCVPYDAAGH